MVLHVVAGTVDDVELAVEGMVIVNVVFGNLLLHFKLRLLYLVLGWFRTLLEMFTRRHSLSDLFFIVVVVVIREADTGHGVVQVVRRQRGWRRLLDFGRPYVQRCSGVLSRTGWVI